MKRTALRTLLRSVASIASLMAAGCCPLNSNQEVTKDVLLDGGIPGDALIDKPLPEELCTVLCANEFSTCAYVLDNGQKVLRCSSVVNYCAGGRRPEGLLGVPEGLQSVAAHFARMAYLEAASVPAFERLAAELSLHGAPHPLIAAARRAATDEVRHARVVRALAKRFGSTPPLLPELRFSPRPLVAMAIENAVEGEVLEAYGAVIATWQSRAASDVAVRHALRVIAEEETSHAELAFAVGAWLTRRLTPNERAQVARAREDAVRSVAIAAAMPVSAELVREAGLPDTPQAVGLAVSTTKALWS